MKKIVFKLLILILVLVIGCDNDYELPSNDYSSFKLTTTKKNDSINKVCNVKDYIAFYDISRNALSHKWITPAATKFLNRNFTELDSIYDKLIIGDGGTTTERLANVYFPEPGLYTINLLNTFKDSVAESVYSQVEGVWVVNKIFTVDVFADPNPVARILYNNVEVFNMSATDNPSIEDKATWPIIEIEAGDQLVFQDETTIGRPTSSKWYFEGGKPETSAKDSTAVLYNKLGEYTATLTSVRNNPSKSILKHLPVRVKVNPSSKPFVINGGVSMAYNNVISFAVTGEVDSVTGSKSNFTVHVTNSASGFDKVIPVETVRVNSLDATIVELILASPVYNTDEITVSFSGANMTSVDSRPLESFGPENVKIDLGFSILVADHVGFEIPYTGNKDWKRAFTNQYWCGSTNDGPYYLERTEELASQGIASMRYTNEAGVFTDISLKSSDFAKPNGYPAGSYYVSYKVYLVEGNTMKGFTTNLNEPSQLLNWNIANLPRGKWIEIGQIITTNEIPVTATWELNIPESSNLGVTGAQKMYFDDLKLIPLVARP